MANWWESAPVAGAGTPPANAPAPLPPPASWWDGAPVRAPMQQQRNGGGVTRSAQEWADAENLPVPGTDWGVPSRTSLPPSRYDQALEAVRRTQYPDMTDQQWSEYSQKFFAPHNFQDATQAAQTLGFGDEINAGVGAFGSQVRNWMGDESSPGFGDAFGTYLDLEQARRDEGREELGGMALAADVLGGFSGIGPARGAAWGAMPINAPANTAQLMTGSVLAGAPFGFAAGFGTADEDRLESGAIGAGIGAAAGRFGPTLANAVSGGYENVANILARNQAATRAGISPGAAGFMAETLSVDGALDPQGLARMMAAGDERMLVDAAPSARRMLDTSIQSSGRAGQVARTAINERVGRDSQAIQRALDDALGVPEGVDTARARIATETAQERSAAYAAADAMPIDYSSDAGRSIEGLLGRVPQQAINRANNLMRIRGETSPQIMATFDEAGNVQFQSMPSVKQLDYITRALNEEASAGIGQGSMGGQTDIGSSLQSLSSQIRRTLGDHVPEYANALEVSGDAIRRSKAAQLGYDMLNPSVTMEDVLRQAGDLSKAERTGLAQGLRSRIEDMVSRVTRTLGNPDTEAREAAKAIVQMSSRGTRTKIEAALGADVAAPLFVELDRAGMSFELAQSVADNSATFARTNHQARVRDLASGGDGPIATAKRGEPLETGKRAIQMATGQTPQARLLQEELLNQEIARLLVSRGPDADRNLQTLLQLNSANQINGDVAQALMGSQRAAIPASNVTTQRYLTGR